MTTPPLNRNAARRHARAARVTGYTPPAQIDREGGLTFVRNTSVVFKGLRTTYTDSEWGHLFQQTLEGSKWKDLIEKILRVDEA